MRRTSPPGAVEPVQARAVPDEREGVGAEAVGDGLGHGERNGGRDRGVDGVAAILQYA